MVDYLKFQIQEPYCLERIRNNHLLLFDHREERYNRSTGELYYQTTFSYLGLKFTFIEDSRSIPKKLDIAGSLHYYKNQNIHNADDFTFYSLISVLADLKRTFTLDLKACRIRSIEFGLNFRPLEYESKRIIENVFCHKRKKFVNPINQPFKRSGNYKTNNYTLKIYDKEYQFPGYIKGECLRFEIKYSRMRDLHKMGLRTLFDITLIENHYTLLNLLVQRFNEILLYDYTSDLKMLNGLGRKNMIKYSNPNFWYRLLDKIEEQRVNYKSFDYHKKRMYNYQINISEELQGKLSQVIFKKGLSLVGILGVKESDMIKRTLNAHITNTTKCPLNTHLFIEDIHSDMDSNFREMLIKRRCVVTGVDISMQKESSKMLSYSGLRHYSNADPQLFAWLKQKFLSKKWVGSDYDIQIHEMYHGIRNKHSDSKRQQRRLYPLWQMQLFNLNFIIH